MPSVVAARERILALIHRRRRPSQPGPTPGALDRQAIERGENEGMKVSSGKKKVRRRGPDSNART
jgi:hypothetical protein